MSLRRPRRRYAPYRMCLLCNVQAGMTFAESHSDNGERKWRDDVPDSLLWEHVTCVTTSRLRSLFVGFSLDYSEPSCPSEGSWFSFTWSTVNVLKVDVLSVLPGLTDRLSSGLVARTDRWAGRLQPVHFMVGNSKQTPAFEQPRATSNLSTVPVRGRLGVSVCNISQGCKCLKHISS